MGETPVDIVVANNVSTEQVTVDDEEERWVPAVYYRQVCRRKDHYAIRLDIFKLREVSSIGNVRNASTKKLLTVRLDGGRRVVTFMLNGKSSKCVVARLMASSFLGKPETPDLTADHIDQNGTHDIIGNLRWATKPQQAKNRRKSTKPAKCIPLTAKHISTGKTRQFKSLSEAADKLKLSMGRISNVLHGKQKSTGGWVFAIRNPPPITGQVFIEYQDSRVFIGDQNHIRDERGDRVVIREIATFNSNIDYPSISIAGREHKLHLLVAEMHVPKPPAWDESWTVHHVNHNKRDARATNLAWVTQSENVLEAHAAGRFDHTSVKRKPIRINGEPFESISAAKRTKRFGSHTIIKKRLENPAITSYVYD